MLTQWPTGTPAATSTRLVTATLIPLPFEGSMIAPLASICGIRLPTAAALAGIFGPGRRLAIDAQLAAYAGVAPQETSAAERLRHRLNGATTAV